MDESIRKSLALVPVLNASDDAVPDELPGNPRFQPEAAAVELEIEPAAGEVPAAEPEPVLAEPSAQRS